MNKFHIGLTKNTESIYEFSNDEIINLKVFYDHNLYINEQFKNKKKRIKVYFIINENNKFIKRVKSVEIDENETNEQKKLISNNLIEDVKNIYKDKLIVDNIEISCEELSKLDDKELSIFRYIPKIINYEDTLNINSNDLSYWIGLWLGDGSTNTYGEITIGIDDQNILLPYIKNLANKLNLEIREIIKKSLGHTKPTTFHMSGNNGNNILNKTFKLLNLINNKHIPEIYLKSLIENRKALLAGLIDSDGATGTSYKRKEKGGKNYCWDLTLKLKNLVDDVEILCKSLGMFTYKSEVKKRAVNMKGIKGNNSEYKTYYRIKITPYNNYDIPLKLERKKICDDILDRQYLPLIKNVRD